MADRCSVCGQAVSGGYTCNRMVCGFPREIAATGLEIPAHVNRKRAESEMTKDG